MVDIYRDAKRRSLYLALGTDPEKDSCFSTYQNDGIKMYFIFVNILKKHTTLFKLIFANMFRQTFAFFSAKMDYLATVTSVYKEIGLIMINLEQWYKRNP